MDYLPPSPPPSVAPLSSRSSHPSSRLERPRSRLRSKLDVFSRRRLDNSALEPNQDRSGSVISKPRKRFRKKVSSIFADNTELKKRVERLFLDVGTEELLTMAAAPVQPWKGTPREDTCTLQVSKEALDMLGTISSSKEAAESRKRMQDHPQFLANAAKIWGEDGVPRVRRHISESKPISFQAFVNVLELTEEKENSPPPTEAKDNIGNVIVPPKRLSAQWFVEYGRKNAVKQRKPINRFGLPAILRKNARRNERGYRIDGRPRSYTVQAMRRTRKAGQLRVTPRSNDAFQMLVEVATEQNAGEKRKRSLGHLLEYADDRNDTLPKNMKKKKLRSN
ncbi:hypothetical protein FGB62_4g241 [Gracilaria domingensis]|nr:hypothetical protein FGB62_4g241 [Gracilaria domingensis]